MAGFLTTGMGGAISSKASASLYPKQITHRVIFRVLLGGFLLVIMLLLAAAVIGVQNLRAIKGNVAGVVSQELVATRLIDDIQHEQAALSAVFSKLSRDPESVNRERVMSELDAADDRIEQIVASVAGTPDAPLWNELQKASAEFSGEARRLLSLEKPTTLLSRDLFKRHEEALALMAKLAAASYKNASKAQSEIERRSRVLVRHSLVLLGACVLLALACALLTVRMTTQLFRRMEQQTSELSRVSWHLLENQETTARRFSHELHDELGQSLTAVKANLLGLKAQGQLDGHRVEDCVQLVNEAIRNVRELSQLLHPTILDDFGLDAGLHWLTEGFCVRTGIEVQYKSNFNGRLPEETETHLFRICQEALTNIARHSGASKVLVNLEAGVDEVRVLISDNGRGLQVDGGAEQHGLGLIGMRARARSAGGEVKIRSAEGKGLEIEVKVPGKGVRREEKDANPVGR
jgi:signal transduction histidine kinase